MKTMLMDTLFDLWIFDKLCWLLETTGILRSEASYVNHA